MKNLSFFLKDIKIFVGNKIITYICKRKSEVMPEVIRVLGFILKFYANDHKPIHIHIIKGDAEVVFEVSEAEVILRDNYGMKPKDLKIAEGLAIKYTDLIIKTWEDFFKKQ